MTIAASNEMVAAGMTSRRQDGAAEGQAHCHSGARRHRSISAGAWRATRWSRSAHGCHLESRARLSGYRQGDGRQSGGCGECAGAARLPGREEQFRQARLLRLRHRAQHRSWPAGRCRAPICQSNKSAAVRFAMAHTHAGRLFNKAAASKRSGHRQDRIGCRPRCLPR